VKAALRQLHSPDADDLASWQPPGTEKWEVLVQALLGPEEGAGEESFDFTVCSMSALAARAEERPTWTQSNLVMARWDYRDVERAVTELCERCEGRDWQEVAVQLARYMHWEFTNYRER
jgi:hypothetical protein